MKLLSYIKASIKRLFRSEKESVDIKGAFITLLYLQGDYEDFLNLFNTFNLGGVTFDIFLDFTEPSEYVTGAFSWTDASWSRWSNLNTLWRLYLNEEIV